MADDDLSRHVKPGYRAKLLHPDGSIETTVAILADTLSEAEKQVEGLTDTYGVEIWLRGQMVRRLAYRSR